MTNFCENFPAYFRQIIFLTIPISLLLLLLRAQIVRVILGVGKFGWADTKLTTACLGILAFNLIAQAFILFLSKTFYAAHNTKIPAIISGATVVFNIALSLLLVWLIKFSPGFNFFLQNFLRLGGSCKHWSYRLGFGIYNNGNFGKLFAFIYVLQKISEIKR